MTAGQHVLLEKLSEHNPGLVVVGHWLKGHLIAPVVVGEPIQVTRYQRAAFEDETAGTTVERLGVFTSSPVEKLGGTAESMVAITRNSTWRITPLPPSTLPTAHWSVIAPND